jgi:hypothetical protein
VSLAQMVFSTQLLALLQRKLGVAASAPEDIHMPIKAASVAVRRRGKEQKRIGRSMEDGRKG